MKHYDVIVVGGSVSGAPTATWLARKGHSVLLLEKEKFPRDTNSTHFIWPRGMSYLNRLGVAEQVLASTPSFKKLEISIEGISLHGAVPIEHIQQRFEKLHGNANGVVDYYAGPRRYFLDKLLLDEARNSGVEVREQYVVEDVLRNNDQVIGVRGLDDQHRPFSAHAKVVVGADGRVSSFAQMVSAKLIHERADSTFAYYGYFSGIQKDELVIHKRGRLGTAIFPTMENRHLVLVYGPTTWWNDFRKNADENFLRTYEYVAPEVAALVKQGKRVEPFKAMGRMVAFHRQNVGPGWVLVGDAGSFKDQWTAMGITHSLRDAELMSTYLDRYLRQQGQWDALLAEYNEIRTNDYEEYWTMVCDGAELKPYTQDELRFFYGIANNQEKVDTFMAQVGDTLSFKHAISPDPRPTPDFIEQYDSNKLGYHQNLYLQHVSMAA